MSSVNSVYSVLRAAVLLCVALCSGGLQGCDDDPEHPSAEAGASLAGTGGEGGAGVEAGKAGAGSVGGEAGAAREGGEEGVEELARYQGLTLNEVVAKGSPDDWVELYNSSSEDISVSGCGLSDDPNNPLKGRFAEGLMVPAGGFLLITVSDESLGFKLGSAEDLSLSTPSGVVIDRVSYQDGASPVGGAYGRLPDGEGPWETLYTQTPGAPNERGEPAVCGDLSCEPSESAERCPEDCVSCGDGLCDPSEVGACDADCPSVMSGDLLINEVLAAGSPDWVELYNLTEVNLDLTGYGLSDDVSTPFKATLSGVLPASGHLTVLVSDETLGFKLGGDELAMLSGPDGVVIDLVDWAEGDSPEGLSWGRSPDGSARWATLAPTPGAPNGDP